MTRSAQILILFALTGSCATTVPAADWPHWRGFNRDGTSTESSRWTGGRWPPAEPEWTVRLTSGGSAPIVVDSRLYTMGWRDEQDHVYCLDTKTGQTIWRQSYSCPRYGRKSEGDKALYDGPSACPSYDRRTGFLLTLSTDGDLNCWDTNKQGKRVWSTNFYDAYRVPQRPLVGRRRLRDYGYTTAPLIVGNVVIAEVGDDEGNLMAFSLKTGKRVWASQCKDPAGHTGGPVPITVDGIPCVAVLTIHRLLVARIDKGHEGQTLAGFPWETDFANNVATPTVHGQSIIITSEYNQYAIARVDISKSGATEKWRQPYASGVCSPVVHKGHVYWCWRGVYCLDYETGKPIWRGGRGYGDTASCISTSDDRLIIWSQRGDLSLAETFSRSPKKYTELARARRLLSSDVWPHIALSAGRLYCKDRSGNLKCFRIAKP